MATRRKRPNRPSTRQTARAFNKAYGKKLLKAPPGLPTGRDWARHPRSDSHTKHTFYVSVRVLSDSQLGYEPLPDDEEGSERVITLALRRPDRKRRLKGMTYAQLRQHFDEEFERSLRRTGLQLADTKKKSLLGIWRHKDK